MVDEFNRRHKWEEENIDETDRSLSGLSADRLNGASTALWTLCLMLDRERAFSSGQWHNGREKVQCIVTEEEGRTYASFENRRLREVGMYIFLPRTFGPNRVSVAPPTLPPPHIIYLTSGKRTPSAALQWIQRWDRNAFEISTYVHFRSSLLGYICAIKDNSWSFEISSTFLYTHNIGFIRSIYKTINFHISYSLTSPSYSEILKECCYYRIKEKNMTERDMRLEWK